MLKRLWILLPVILLCLVLGAKEVPREASSQTQGRPNILLVLTDDQDVGSVSEMPNVQSQLVDRGTTYDRAFVTTPLCCPSRASILRGQYAHNHKLWDNKAPEGGFRGFQELGLEESTVARWLDEAGYHTGFIGKYLNEYGSYEHPTTHVPPGWDWWIGYEGGPQAQHTEGAFKVNDQAKVERIEAVTGYDTDYFARKAETYIKNRQASKPWFLMVATNAPHVPAQASARNDNAYAGHTMPKTPSFNESDISDKASPWRDNALLPEECPRTGRRGLARPHGVAEGRRRHDRKAARGAARGGIRAGDLRDPHLRQRLRALPEPHLLQGRALRARPAGAVHRPGPWGFEGQGRPPSGRQHRPRPHLRPVGEGEGPGLRGRAQPRPPH